MKLRKASAVVGLATVGLVGLSAGVASAYTAPYNDPSVIGGLTLENSSGTAIQTGNIQDDPSFNFAVGTGAANRVVHGVPDNIAQLNICTPNSAVTDPSAWVCDQLGDGSNYNPSGAPTDHWQTGDGLTIGEYIALEGRQTATSGAYQGIYQIRLVTTQAGQSPNSGYYATTIQVTEGTPGVAADGTPTATGTYTDLNYTAPATPNLPEAPLAALLPLAALGLGGAVVFSRRRKGNASVLAG